MSRLRCGWLGHRTFRTFDPLPSSVPITPMYSNRLKRDQHIELADFASTSWGQHCVRGWVGGRGGEVIYCRPLCCYLTQLNTACQQPGKSGRLLLSSALNATRLSWSSMANPVTGGWCNHTARAHRQVWGHVSLVTGGQSGDVARGQNSSQWRVEAYVAGIPGVIGYILCKYESWKGWLV